MIRFDWVILKKYITIFIDNFFFTKLFGIKNNSKILGTKINILNKLTR